MPATIVMGGQWGDEGKGKLVDALASSAAMVVRANGGNNAGHTVATDAGVFKLHLVPSGILYPAVRCLIGPGVVIEPTALVAELDALTARGIDLANFAIADRAHLVLPYHPILDRLEETHRAAGEIGTTGRGNGPAYADKVARHGLRVADLLDETALLRKLAREVEAKNRILSNVYGEPELNLSDLYHQLVGVAAKLRPFIVAGETLVQDALADGEELLVECAQGAMLDVDYGAYPYVTSSSTTAAGACQGAAVAPTQVRRVIAVFKAYSTRVGGGPFPTELANDLGDTIRERGREYGTTTGRPRRTGWFDAVAGRSVARMNGVSEIALTLLDVLDEFASVDVCTAYRLGNESIDHVPARDDLLAAVSPRYETLPGWREPLTALREGDPLPQNAIAYVRFLERAVGAPITMVGVGPNREQLVPLTAPSPVGALAR
jgi:adenylosuccinate synthase